VRFLSHLPGPWEIKETRTNIPDAIEVKVKAEEPGGHTWWKCITKGENPAIMPG
jgi:hypothetical protein